MATLSDILQNVPGIYDWLPPQSVQALIQQNRACRVAREREDMWCGHAARGFGVLPDALPAPPQGYYRLVVGMQSLLQRRIRPQARVRGMAYTNALEISTKRYLQRHFPTIYRSVMKPAPALSERPIDDDDSVNRAMMLLGFGAAGCAAGCTAAIASGLATATLYPATESMILPENPIVIPKGVAIAGGIGVTAACTAIGGVGLYGEVTTRLCRNEDRRRRSWMEALFDLRQNSAAPYDPNVFRAVRGHARISGTRARYGWAPPPVWCHQNWE